MQPYCCKIIKAEGDIYVKSNFKQYGNSVFKDVHNKLPL